MENSEIFSMTHFEHKKKHYFIIVKIIDDGVNISAYHDIQGKKQAIKINAGYSFDTRTAEEWRSKMVKSRISYLIDFIKKYIIDNE